MLLYVTKGKYYKKELLFTELHEVFKGIADEERKNGSINEVRAKGVAATYLLYILGTCVFHDSKGNIFNANYLQLLDPLEKVSEYSWGTNVLSHLNEELKKVSKERTSQINGNLNLLQIYEHFSLLVKDHPKIEVNNEWKPDQPSGTR